MKTRTVRQVNRVALHLGRPQSGGGRSNEDISSVLELLASTKAVKSEIIRTRKQVNACVHITTGDNKHFDVDLDLFEAAYKGMVKCWPSITSVRPKYHQLRRQAEIELQKSQAED